MDIKEVISKFEVSGAFVSAERYGTGHINETYKTVTERDGRVFQYVVQKINRNVFKDVDALMANIYNITEHIKNNIERHGGDAKRALSLIPLAGGGVYYESADGECYRCYNFIDNVESIEIATSPEQLFLAGEGYGKFQKYLDGFPAEKLFETIPNFHNTEDRYNKFILSVDADGKDRAKNVKDEIAFYRERREYASRVLNLMRTAEIPQRVTHNDTKLNNILIDTASGKAVTAVDLDTVMPGSIVYDFGDSIRSGANLGAEDDLNLDNVIFSLDYFRAFAKGFLGETAKTLASAEIKNLAFGSILMTYECGMRFLTDYLNGDVYFRIHRDSHNLDRARTQMRMVRQMEKLIGKMDNIVSDYV